MRAPRGVCIDGPAGSGKSTLAAWLSDVLQMEWTDSGLWYRAVALAAIQGPATPGDGAIFLRIEMVMGRGQEQPPRVALDGRDVTALLRSAAVEAAVSEVAAVSEIRHAVNARCRQLLGRRNAIVTGRDIGANASPPGVVKLFLSCSGAIRGQRISAHGAGTVYAAQRREELDSHRLGEHHGPASDAVIIDTTALSIDEVRRYALAALYVPT